FQTLFPLSLARVSDRVAGAGSQAYVLHVEQPRQEAWGWGLGLVRAHSLEGSLCRGDVKGGRADSWRGALTGRTRGLAASPIPHLSGKAEGLGPPPSSASGGSGSRTRRPHRMRAS
ncbi:hypothetical protein NDU88_005413, partial [Pleurodeles waltl]